MKNVSVTQLVCAVAIAGIITWSLVAISPVAHAEETDGELFDEYIQLIDTGADSKDAAVDPHAGHNHAPGEHPGEEKVDAVDPHAGHNHAPGEHPGEEKVDAVDPHAGHNHAPGEHPGEEKVDAVDPHAGHNHAEGEHPGEEKATEAGDPHAGHDHAEGEHPGEEKATEAVDPHAGHDHGTAEGVPGSEPETGIELTAKQIKDIGIEISQVKPGYVKNSTRFPGDIVVNDDLLSHIVPRVPGTVIEVNKRLGDSVKKGDVLAVLDSRDLADAKSDYLATIERLALEEVNYSQEERIFKKNISSERDFLNAKKAVAEARINIRSARQKLIALGLDKEDIKNLPDEPDEKLTYFEITAPFDGTIIEKHITLGETIKEDDDSSRYVIADLSTVWINLQIYQKDLHLIHKGKTVTITVGHGIPDATGIIEYVGQIVDGQTRTGVARIVLPNKTGIYRPGLFVTANVELNHVDAALCVEKAAVQEIEGEAVVFVETAHGFNAQPVKLGSSDAEHVEILSGLKPGQRYVIKGAFDLKAHMLTSNMDPHAGHGH